MFVITADQVDSQRGPDIVAPTLTALNKHLGDRLTLPIDRNAGDELQALTDDPATALEIITTLARGRAWSIGLGIGAVRSPLPASTREASGDAFVAARAAVTRAKRATARFAAEAVAAATSATSATDIEALVGLLLTLRAGRSAAGWQLYDLVATGMTQAEAGAQLGITPQSASDRARAASLRADLAAQPALVRLLEAADAIPRTDQTAERTPTDGT